MNNIGTFVSPSRPTIAPRAAVARFLKDMATVARRSFPAWQDVLTEGIEECALSYDARRAVLDVHPLDDYYFAAVVALEAAKIRRLFDAAKANELLSLIGEQVDAVAGRNDRALSDLVFFLIGRIDVASTPERNVMAYDEVVRALLERLGIGQIEATQALMRQVLFRHLLGEPLALGVPHWWNRFASKYTLETPLSETSTSVPSAPLASVPTTLAPRPRPRKRAVLL